MSSFSNGVCVAFCCTVFLYNVSYGTGFERPTFQSSVAFSLTVHCVISYVAAVIVGQYT